MGKEQRKARHGEAHGFSRLIHWEHWEVESEVENGRKGKASRKHREIKHYIPE